MAQSEIISDLLTMPLEERAKVHSMNPQISTMLEQALASDPDYAGLPDSEKVAIRANLGFSTPTPAVNSLVNPINNLVNPSTTKPSFVPVTSAAAPEAKEHPLLTDIKELLLNPIRSALSPETSILETPLGNVDIGRKSVTGSLVRGTLGAVPGLSAAVPTPAPDFFSIENTAKIATEIMITAPLMGAKVLTTATPALAGFYQMFLRYPKLAHAIANSTLQAVPAAAFATTHHYAASVFSGEMSKLMAEGKLSLAGIAQEFGKDVAQTTALILGFKGALAAGKAGYTRLMRKPSIAAPVVTPVPPPLTPAQQNQEIVKQVAQDIGEMPVAREGNILDLAKQAITTPVKPTQDLLRVAERTLAQPKPGFLMSAEEKLRQYPKASQIVDDVLEPTNARITALGIEASVPETVLKATFIPAEDAIVGDLIYVSTKAGQRIAKVIEKRSNGVVVQSLESPARFLVPFAKVTGKVESKFQVGDSAFKASGEQVTVQSVVGSGMLRVVDQRGSRYAIDASKLSTESEQLGMRAAAERAAVGIDTPEPSGNSVFELLSERISKAAETAKGETGGIRFGGSAQPPNPNNVVIDTITTQPGRKDFGTSRYFLPPWMTLLNMGEQRYDLIAEAIHTSKVQEAILENGSQEFLRAAKKLVGSNTEVSARLSRALLGVSKPKEILSQAEQAVVYQFQEFGKRTVIPLINASRAVIGLKPVPSDYNYVMHLFPELVLTAGYRGNGLAKSIAPTLKFSGTENILDSPWGQNARINIGANFWEIADSLVKFVSHETAWGDTIMLVKNMAAAEKSAINRKYLGWLDHHLSGKSVSPSVSDASNFMARVDSWLPKKTTTTIELPQGKTISIDVPIVSLADKSLRDFVMDFRTLNYAAMIGFNMRTVFLNLSQPFTDGLARIPGNPLAAAFNNLAGYTKGIGSLFSKEMQQKYHELGVLSNVEDIFSEYLLTRTTGGPIRNTLYAKDWLLNNLLGLSFKGMRFAEIVNRVTTFEGRKLSTEQIARKGGVSEKIINSPEFQEDIRRLSTYTTNLGNFLYGKGFKSPVQSGEIPIGSGRGLDIGPLGELMYMFNTFATNHFGNMVMLAKQSQRFGDHMDAAARMASRGASPEFANYLANIEPKNRNAFLKAILYQTGMASLMSSMVAASFYTQLLPWKMTGVNWIPPIVENINKIVKDITTLNIPGALGTAVGSVTPGLNAARRFARGGTWLESFTATGRDIKGTEPVGILESVGVSNPEKSRR